jgi:hypothetical protein
VGSRVESCRGVYCRDSTIGNAADNAQLQAEVQQESTISDTGEEAGTPDKRAVSDEGEGSPDDDQENEVPAVADILGDGMARPDAAGGDIAHGAGRTGCSSTRTRGVRRFVRSRTSQYAGICDCVFGCCADTTTHVHAHSMTRLDSTTHAPPTTTRRQTVVANWNRPSGPVRLLLGLATLS